jgi:hypothetical protein
MGQIAGLKHVVFLGLAHVSNRSAGTTPAETYGNKIEQIFLTWARVRSGDLPTELVPWQGTVTDESGVRWQGTVTDESVKWTGENVLPSRPQAVLLVEKRRDTWIQSCRKNIKDDRYN